MPAQADCPVVEGDGGDGELGMQRKGRRDRETPKIEPHRKIRPQDTVPREELPFLEHVVYVGFSSPCFMCIASLRSTFAIPLSSSEH